MIRKVPSFLLLAAASLPLQAQPPVQQAPASIASGAETVQCPQYLEGWPYEMIDIHDCGIPGVNVKSVCQKWNNNQISVPTGWDYDGVKRYGSINHIVASHYIATVANKTNLYCGYSTNRGSPNITTYVIRRQAPTGKNCQTSANYSFRCTSRALDRIKQFRR